MKAQLLVIATFLGLVIVGSVAYAAIDAFVLGHIDGKFAHSAIDQFTLILVLGGVLTIGSVVPLAALVFGLGRLVVPHRLVFTVVSASAVLASFVTEAYVPLAEWIEPAMPRNAVYAFVVAAIIGGVGAVAGLAACLVRQQVARA